MTTIGDRIKELRSRLRMSQGEFSDALGIKQATISFVENGRQMPTIDLLIKLNETFETSFEELILGRGGSKKNVQTSIPIISTPAAAGFFITMESGESGNSLEDRIVIPDINYRKVHVAIRVVGGSMYPTIHDGDIIVCRKLETLDDFVSGKVYVVVLIDGTVAVKRVYMDTETALLRSDNISILDKNIPRTEIQQIWEVITRLTHNLQPEDIQKKFPI